MTRRASWQARTWGGVALAAALGACGSAGRASDRGGSAARPDDGRAGSSARPAASDARPAVEPTPPPPPALAATPRLSLDANLPRAHRYAPGLLIEPGAASLPLYEQTTRSAFVTPRRADPGGSTLTATASLTLPWLAEDGAGPATLRVVGRGGAVTVTLGGKKLGTVKLGASDGMAELAIPDGALVAGEHTLTLTGRATLRSIEVVPAALATAPACAAGTARRLSWYGELPATAQLVAHPTGATSVRVRIARDGQAPALVFDGAASALPAQLDLGVAATTMARLDLEADGCASWAGAELAVLAPAGAPPPAARPVDNVVLIVVDTLRSDRLRAYGDTRVLTPRITALAERGAVMQHNQSMAPSSPPSHAAIHSGQIPRVHGVVGDEGQLAQGAPLLGAIAKGAGFFTGFVGNNDFAMSRLKAASRWDVAETPFYKHGKDCGPMFARAVELIGQARAKGKRFFLSLLPIEPHVAYRFHAGVTDVYFDGPWAPPLGKLAGSKHLARMKGLPGTHRDWTQLRALYDGEVTHVDACVGVLEDGLRAAGVLDQTAIVITSDHGEGMGERPGAAGHAYSLHRELVDVPLIIAGGVAPTRLAVATSNADIAPTVLALLGLPADARMQGRSLLGDLQDGGWPRLVASEYGKAYALRAAGYHFVVGYDGRGSLYDVATDAAELTPVNAERPIAWRAMRDGAGMYLAHRVAWRGATWGALGALANGNPLAAR
jgi:arylsulfatase A-like enzyme